MQHAYTITTLIAIGVDRKQGHESKNTPLVTIEHYHNECPWISSEIAATCDR